MGCGFAHPLYGGGMLLSVAKGMGTEGVVSLLLPVL